MKRIKGSFDIVELVISLCVAYWIFTAFFGDSIETRVGPQEHKFGASQKIPFPGKLDLKGKAQAKGAEMLQEEYEAAKREIIKNVKNVSKKYKHII